MSPRHTAVGKPHTPTRIVYSHPPKCAGTSIVRALRIRYLWRGMGLTAHSMKSVFDNADPPIPYEEYQFKAHTAADAVAAYNLTHGKRLVAGHFWYGECLRLLGTDVLRMTVIREPVARFLSHYRYLVWKYQLKEEFTDFLNSDRAVHLGSIYGFYFANQYPGGKHQVDTIVQRAVSSLDEFAVIGDVADLKGFLSKAKSLVGGPMFAMQSNRTPASVKPDAQLKISDADRARIQELTVVDRLIYAEVQNLSNYVRHSPPSRELKVQIA